ncbi:MAG: alpha/beta fold hydrolase [Actinomycetota bacterium]|nr:alpha/beta fold hydrolase [Actinomycetota bacterium]
MALDLSHTRLGSGEPLLLVHGLGGSKVMWEPLYELLAPRRELIAVDMPGFGRSPPMPEGVEPSAANIAAAILDFSDTLELGSLPHVCGNSLGGWVAIEAARQRRARSVVGLCTAGFWSRPVGPRRSQARTAARLLAPLAGLLLGSERVKSGILAAQVRHPERVSREQALDMVRSYATATGYDRANALMRGNVIGDVSALGVPLTLAWGERDNLVRRTPLPGVSPSVRQVVLPDSGHVPTWDAPELVAELILDAARVETAGGVTR